MTRPGLGERSRIVLALLAIGCGSDADGQTDAASPGGDAAAADGHGGDAASNAGDGGPTGADTTPTNGDAGPTSADAAASNGADATPSNGADAAAIDAAPACQPSELRLTEAAGDSTGPALVAIPGGGYAVVWLDGRDGQGNLLYFARLDANGHKLGGDVRITTEGGGLPSLVWNGNGYAVAFGTARIADNAEIYFLRLDVDGHPVAPELRVTDAPMLSLSASLAYTGSGYGVAWNDMRAGNADIFFTRIDAAGAKLGDDLRISESARDEFRPWLVWNGDGFGLTWNDQRDDDWEIYVALLDASGGKRGLERRITSAPGNSLFPALVWSGAGYGLTWNDVRDGRAGTYFRRLDAAAMPVGNELVLGSGSPMGGRESLVWTGSGYGLAFSDPRDGAQALHLARLDAVGAEVGAAVRVAGSPGYQGGAALAAAAVGGGFGMAWQDSRHGQPEIYFARICP